jgi:putative two-component system response regulator
MIHWNDQRYGKGAHRSPARPSFCHAVTDIETRRAQGGERTMQDLRILVVDDEPANTRLLEQLLSRWGHSNVCALNDPRRVSAAVQRTCPDLLLLDLHMPRRSGYDVMRDLRARLGGRTPLPILILTAHTSPDAIHQAFSLGARDFVTKPFDHEEVRLRVRNLLEMRLLQVRAKAYGDLLEARVRERTAELETARVDLLRRLAIAGEYRDHEAEQHAQRIGRTAGLLADAVGLSAEDVRRIVYAAPLHDVGKIAIPDAILLKPERLTAEEFETIKTHPRVGARILGGSDSRLLRMAADIAASHHERWDGQGYPHGLAGEAIPLTGRIVAVADVFDALTHRRPYKPAWSAEQAVSEIVRQGGRQFDPNIVAAFRTLDHIALVGPLRVVPAPDAP